MKKLFRLLMSVVAVAGTLACTTDATEDLSVKVGGKTQLTLSLDNSRTQLGEKANNAYPLTWAAGDQISVNGVASEPLGTEDGAGTANATFTFGGALTTPYFVAYPATAEGQVLFAAEQNHASNTTFGNNAAVMYGYSANGENIQLKHLTGILKIGIEGSAKITTVRISTIDRKPIAGAFKAVYDTEKQEVTLTPVENATSSVITYNLFDTEGNAGIDLSMQNETTYIHVAVPAGEYNELYVTIEDEMGGVMYATVTTDETKPLNAGKVREFNTTIEYAAMDGVDTFVISDFASLITLKEELEAAQAVLDNAESTDDAKAEATATLSKSATVVNDVEITPAQINDAGGWTEINATNYIGTINGNGYQISGLPTPLFNVTAASFKGLHMNTSIEETENPNFGAFARQLVANGNAPKVENCSVSGTITINTAITPTASTYTEAATGAFAGIADGVHFENCVNNAAVNIESVVASDASKTTWSSVGGFVGYVCSANNLAVTFTNCENKGALTIVEGDQSKIGVCVGGFIAVYYGNETNAINTTFDNCRNSGNINQNASIKGLHGGGILGYSVGFGTVVNYFKFNTATTNSGKITQAGTTSADVRVGGIIGYVNNYIRPTFNGHVTNSGEIAFSGNHTGTNWNNIGGILGFMTKGCRIYFYAGATNAADIKVTGSISDELYCGGLIGRATQGDVTTRINYFGGTVANNGNIYLSTTVGDQFYIGGLVGYSSMTGVRHDGNVRVINNGDITLENTTAKSNLWIGGIQGGLDGGGTAYEGTSSKGQRANRGNITFSGEVKGNCYIGGLGGYHNLGVPVESVNTGNITVTAKFNSEKTNRVAGGYANHRIATHDSPIVMQNAQVYCDIIAYTTTKNSDGTYTFTPYPNVGIFSGQSTIKEIKNCKVGGRIAVGAAAEGDVVTPTWTTLTNDNYLDYMVGVRNCTISTETPITNKFTSITLLSSVDNVVWGNYGE